MANQRIVFGEWLPDQPGVSGTLVDAKNVYPTGVGYAPFPSVENYSQDASENLNSLFVGKYGSEVQVFAGGFTKIFKLDNTDLSLDDVSKSGGYSSAFNWNFTQFGSVVIGANNSNKLQSWTIGSSTQFADLDANAPVAKYVTVIRDFVFAGNLDNGTNSNKVIWSDINSETTWVSGSTSQSDFQFLPDGGNITGMVGGEFGLIFLERAIYRCTYSGSPLFWQFDTISKEFGCLEGNSITQYGNITYFLSDTGFFQCDGISISPIGTEKVDRYFFDDVDLSDLNSISSTVDPVKKIIVWNYKNSNGGRSMLIYNIQLQKWSRAETTANVIGTIATSGTTLEALDTTLGYTSIETIPASLDDRLWIGGKYLFAGVVNAKIVGFTGTNYNSEIITPDIEVGYNSMVILAKPQIDNGSATVKIASRKNLNDNILFGSLSTASSEGRASLRSVGRYHRLSINPTGSWTNAVSVDVEINQMGLR